jgi:hypothetical protein
MGRSKRNKSKGFKYEHPPEEIEIKPKIFLDTLDGLKLVRSAYLNYEKVREIIRPPLIPSNSNLLN